jgi:hypothetical protein
MMRSGLIISIAVAALLLSLTAGSQNTTLPDFDPSAAERHFREENPNRFSKSLHEFERYPDGARGFGVGIPMVHRVALPDPLPPPFKTEREWETYYVYCGWDAIVRATQVDSTPILTSNQGLVYTVSHFVVEDTIKSDIPYTPGQHLVVYRVGGEVDDGGEKVQIVTLDMAAFEPQKSYILILRRDKNASVQQYWIPETQTIVVTDGKVYPISGKIAWLSGMDAFPTGTTYTALRNTFAKVRALKSCSDAR